MILFYTGAVTPNISQVNPTNSLGGYVSNSPVPNGKLNNLFSAIAKSDVLQNRSVIRMIALKNTTGADVTGVKIYTNIGLGHVKLQLAAVAPAMDSNNNPVFESVYDGNSLPYQAQLDYHESIDNAIDVGTLANGATIGIWILRETDQTKFPELTTGATGKALSDILEAAQASADESVNVVIQYN